MKTAAELKLEARKALLGNYGNASGAVVVMYLIGFLLMIPFVIVMMITGLAAINWSNTQITATIGFPVITVIYMMISLLMMVGYVRLCYRIAIGEEGEVGDLFFAVKTRFSRYLRLAGLLVIYSILSWLPGILVMFLSSAGGRMNAGFFVGYLLALIIPVAVLCRYAMAMLAMVEDPQMRAMEAMRFSRDLMRGNIWRMIRLELSFFGMYLLGVLTMGIGYIWITPYLVCTNILFYLTIKEEKYPLVIRTEEDEAMEARFERAMPELPEFPG